MSGGKIIKLADHNGFSSSRTVQDALQEAGEIAEERGLKTVLVLLLDAEGDSYDIEEVSAGLDRYTDALALLETVKTRTAMRLL